MNKKIIIANWKMNPRNLEEAKRIFNEIKKTANKMQKVDVIICPPFVFHLRVALGKDKGSPWIGAQDVFYENPRAGGSYTGEISADMLKNLRVKYVIIGHSERRYPLLGEGETNEIINKKIKTALSAGLKVVFCVGEKERDIEGRYLHFIREEIIAGLDGIQKKFLKNLIIAYEPIWAISANVGAKADNPESSFEISMYIRRALLSIAGEKIARSIPILYGGSISPKNAEDFLRDNIMQGLLVGRASLNSKSFNEILKIANQI